MLHDDQGGESMLFPGVPCTLSIEAHRSDVVHGSGRGVEMRDMCK